MNPPYQLIKSSTLCHQSDKDFCVSNELRRGTQATADLLRLMRQRKNSSNANVDSLHSAFVLVMKIIDSFSNSLSILASQDPPLTGGLTASSKSKNSSLSSGGKMCHKPSYRKGDSWTQVTSNLSTDGYAWRKYGQKPILNSKHPRHACFVYSNFHHTTNSSFSPYSRSINECKKASSILTHRSYYKCTNKPYCQALKRVQKMDDEPLMYKITHTGHHTCGNRHSATSFSDMDYTSIFFNFDREINEQSVVKFPADRDGLANVSSSFRRVEGAEECKNQQYYSGLNPNNNQPLIVEEMETTRSVQWSLDDYDYLIGSVEFNDLHT